MATKHGFPWSTGASLYKWVQVWLESATVGKSCLLEKAGSKRHADYTLEYSFPGTSCFCFKSNYLDSWPNDCLPSPQDDPAACLLARSYFCKKASKIIIEMICLLQVLSPVGGGDYWHLPGQGGPSGHSGCVESTDAHCEISFHHKPAL